MISQLGGYAWHLAALLVGGVAPTIGLTLWARSNPGRALLARTSGRLLALVALGALAVGGGAAWWAGRRVLDATVSEGALPSPAALLLLGLVVGLPLALPSVLVIRSEARARAGRGHRKNHVATKDDRRAFAEDLERQIRELGSPPREVRARIGGEGGRTLVLEGDLDSGEGERLASALRRDLKELGFRRLEGTGAHTWWTRV